MLSHTSEGAIWIGNLDAARSQRIQYSVGADARVTNLAATTAAMHLVGDMSDETRIAIDPRAAARLPSRFRVTVRGLGPFKHLDLDLDGGQWGVLLYD